MMQVMEERQQHTTAVTEYKLVKRESKHTVYFVYNSDDPTSR